MKVIKGKSRGANVAQPYSRDGGHCIGKCQTVHLETTARFMFKLSFTFPAYQYVPYQEAVKQALCVQLDHVTGRGLCFLKL